MKRWRLTLVIWSWFCLFLGASWVFITQVRFRPLEIVTCDVGQGDGAIFFLAQSVIVVDVGPDLSFTRCLQANLFWWQKQIDVVIISHLDKDHVGGLDELLNEYAVKLVIWNGSKKVESDWEKSLEILKERSVRVLVPQPGDLLVGPGWRWFFYPGAGNLSEKSPGENLENDATFDDDENQQSLASHVVAKGFGFLSLGDQDCKGELAVARLLLLKQAPILKISHHGSKTATCANFLQEMRTEVAIVSVGKGNKYGHPEEKVLNTLEQQHTFLLRTDFLGEIHLFPQVHRWFSRP